MSMKRLGLLLAGLAAAKIGTIEHLQRSATRDALVAVHAKDAIVACQRATPVNLLKPGALWASTLAVRVEVGNRRTDVALWQVDHTDWQARFRRPYLVLHATTARCHFDLTTGTASVTEL